MGWLYDTSVALSEEQKLVRRQTIDLYACIAHYSALVPPLVLLLVRLVRRAAPLWSPWARRSSPDGHGRYAEVPRSPIAKAHRRDASGSVTVRWTRLRWWLCDDVYFRGAHWGRREEWLLGFAWALWLLALCVMDTGTDYLHLTKRFGAIAVSQLPIQFLLALKALNPFAFAFHSSHEDVNRYHRVLGRIVYGLLILHALFYNYFFLVAGIWRKRFFALIVFLGVVAFAAMSALTTTSLVRVRQYSYRLFFITHLLAAILVPVLIFFHAPSARLYLVETLLIFGLDLAVRKMTTVTSASSFEVVRGTNLVKISSAIPLRKLANFKARPGSHVYLNVPPRSRPATNRAVFDFLFNPFTVASVDEGQGTMTLVARVRSGPMTRALDGFASAAAGTGEPRATVPLAVEGPYGSAGRQFRDLVGWGAARFLLIAGGVGATFVLPVYRALRDELPAAKVQLVWAVRSAGDAAWAKALLDDDADAQLFVTGDDADAGPDAVEMAALGPVADRRRRPDLSAVVDGAFRHGLEEPVAVLVCGPAAMAREARRRVRPWAMRGRKVWWHSESFGW